ncbi:pyranose 2-oxidase [Metarhizium robertsii ARSEF 23]|uniref:Pyranose 2-oxidase n=1 Tax=Metarhizium robertsii (strain ARSEF 23 / ATCC MYA-3075) TaxID=655844 RepID=E9F704_METRA|nr:pyranose 2-oxidase [Metarhizium robertsii ARSEF 23]EFY96556.2 pyranose 2-oxidase [Metarhizium robertsii ARSEF 23]
MPTNQTQKEEKPALPVKVDVLIVGSGPIGAVFARELVNAQLKNREDLQILMVDVGPHVVKGQLQHLSVPTGDIATQYIRNGQNPAQKANENLAEAAASRVVGGMGSHWTCCTPRQHLDEQQPGFTEVYKNYDRAEHLFNTTTTAFDHSVRQHLIMHTLEKAFNDRPIKAMPLACRRNKSPDNTNYVEWTCPATILDSGVRGHREKLSDPKYSKVPPTRAWERDPITLNDKFEVWPNTQCVKLNLAEDKDKNVKVVSASLKHLLTNAVYNVTADKFVICAGAVLTPGILWNSGFTTDDKKPSYYVKELGKNLTEQTMAFCQVELWKEHVENVMTQPPVVDEKPFDPKNPTRRPVKDTNITNKPRKEDLPKVWGDFWNTTAPKYWIEREKAEKRDEQQANASWVALRTELKDKVAKHVKTFQLDPLPFPADDPDPQCYYSYVFTDTKSKTNKRWHTQIHRDAFGYGQVPADIDQRRVVDLRWFGYTEENGHNCVEFSTNNRDEFGMPQPTFHFTEDKSQRQADMRADMVTVANRLGAIISKEDVHKNMPQGSALHICGTYKAGIGDKADERSVVNQYGQMWKHPNVVLGGCGVIPKANACNPTLTAACFAIHAVKKMVEDLDK